MKKHEIMFCLVVASRKTKHVTSNDQLQNSQKFPK